MIFGRCYADAHAMRASPLRTRLKQIIDSRSSSNTPLPVQTKARYFGPAEKSTLDERISCCGRHDHFSVAIASINKNALNAR
jgi:hypothetical protein